MGIWMKGDSQQVYMNISGDVYAEHIDFLQDKLLDHVQYGYRRIVININDVDSFDSHGLVMLRYVSRQVSKSGGELIIEDKKGVVGELNFT
ncbi:MAG TPA: STAS domain-containing protein [Negativicutes bacterium]